MVLVLAGLVGCGALSALAGCTDRDQQFAARLADLPALDLRPEGAVPVEEHSGCDTDSGFAYAGRRYRSPLDQVRILAFYREAVPRDGWRLTGEQGPPRTDALIVSSARLCFVKEVDGTSAFLAIWFPSDLEPPPEPGVPRKPPEPRDVFGVEITGSHDGHAWC